MSSFFVPKGNIDATVRLFEKQARRKPLSLTQLGKALWKMNALALDARYGNTPEEIAEYDLAMTGYQYRTGDVIRMSDIQLIKAAHCLMYQCEEGKVPEMPLFIELVSVITKAEADYVAALPAYSSALWSITFPKGTNT